MSDPAVLVDARNLLCPMPIMRTEAAMRKLATGATLEVRATDPGMEHDLAAWCEINGHRLIEIKRRGRELIGLVEKGS